MSVLSYLTFMAYEQRELLQRNVQYAGMILSLNQTHIVYLISHPPLLASEQAVYPSWIPVIVDNNLYYTYYCETLFRRGVVHVSNSPGSNQSTTTRICSSVRGRVSPIAYVLTSLVLSNRLYFLDSFHCSSHMLQPIFGRGRGAGRKKPWAFTQHPALCNTRKGRIATCGILHYPGLVQQHETLTRQPCAMLPVASLSTCQGLQNTLCTLFVHALLPPVYADSGLFLDASHLSG